MSRPPGRDGGAESDLAGALTPVDDSLLFEGDARDDGRGNQAPIIDLVDRIVNRAVKGRASDIHVEPTGNRIVVRHRLDGILREVIALPKLVHDGLVARLKVLAGMDIAEKRLPQDGRLRVQVDDNREVDLRVSTLRTMYGEKIVLRVLDQRKGPPQLRELGGSRPVDWRRCATCCAGSTA